MTGLLFGSFNPIHIGHLIIAEYMKEHAKLDEVWFIVSPHNPLKDQSSLAKDELRLQMVKLAIKGNENFVASDAEFKLEQPSYTINTLETLSKKFPKKKFGVIMGSDSLESIFKWKEWSTILSQYMILVFRRGPINDIEWAKYPGVIFFDTPLLKISSTLIRTMIGDKKSVRYLVPDPVLKFIVQKKLYKKKKS
ncbi:MAG TPA: nicotinate (nicotinamide) nucleotide adenylyltransferase [Chitinophagales bacterium]|nr:nicotinate (nicotinamide) nucleotide adenylyltransferase [Chitinophagales bacterium]